MLIRHSSRAAFALASCVTVVRAQATEQTQAAIQNPTQECAPYGYAPVTAIINTYPPVWQTASLNFSGVTTSAKSLYASIQPNIPNIAPRGTPIGDWTGVTYDTANDPDCWWTRTKCTTPKLTGLPTDITECDEGKTLGYTLDDGPNCSHNAFYDYLREQNQKATLFYIGSNVVDWPLQAQRGLDDGHEICAHTWSHPYMTALSNEEAFAELYYSKKAIKDVLGITVQCWRPPYGDVDDRIRYLSNALGMRVVIWSHDTDDWHFATEGNAYVDANYQNLVTSATSAHGDIVLAHELFESSPNLDPSRYQVADENREVYRNDGTMNLSQAWLPTLQKTFTGGVMPISVCRNDSRPYVETTATYPTYAQWVLGTRQVTIPQPNATSNPDDGIVWSFVNNTTPAQVNVTSNTTATSDGNKSNGKNSTVTSGSDAGTKSSSTEGKSNSTTTTTSGATQGRKIITMSSMMVVLGGMSLFVSM